MRSLKRFSWSRLARALGAIDPSERFPVILMQQRFTQNSGELGSHGSEISGSHSGGSDTVGSDTVGGGCHEYIEAERRRWMSAVDQNLLGGALRGLAGRRAKASIAALSAASLPKVAFAGGGSGPARDILVFVMLRGGMDGISLCVPHADPDYASSRGNAAVPGPGQLNGVTDLDGFFGLSPAASALLPAYQAGELAFIQTVGSTDPTRSHFDQMKFMEGGVPDQGASIVNTGWLGRHLATSAPTDPAASLRGVAIDFQSPLTLAGGPKTLSIPQLANFEFAGFSYSDSERKALLAKMYSRETSGVRASALSSLATVDVLGGIDFVNYAPSGGAVYPNVELGDRFKSAAALIKADVGVEAIEIDRGGWDHHDNMGPNDGRLAEMLTELSQTLAAFRTDLGALMGNVTVVAISEFGRRVDMNGAGGSDHGRGGCMMVMGGNVNGGQVIHDWVGLDPSVLDFKSLPVRVDYRDIMIEILTERLASTNAASLFPNHTTIADWNVVR